METNQLDEWAEKYALGQMTGDEKARFEKLLAGDPSLHKKVNFFSDLERAINYDSDVLQFRKAVSEIGREYIQEERDRRNRTVLIRTVLAAAVILMLLVTALLLKDVIHKPHTANEIYAAYYHPYTSGITFRSGSLNDQAIYDKARKLYEEGQYKEAATVFEQFLKTNPGDPSALLYDGIAHMEMNEFHTAETNFQVIIDQGNNLFVEQADWYSGLCLLMQDEKYRAIAHFNKLAKGNGYYQKQATSLLERLK